MSSRDACSDTGRLGAGSSSTRANSTLTPQDFTPTTLAEQNALGGYNKVDVPEGGIPPRQKTSHGSAGGSPATRDQ